MEFPQIERLKQKFDCVLMLTWSDWNTEPRSNRYHYAIRFAELLPVFFVQPDGDKGTFSFEPTEVANVVILHVSEIYDSEQAELLALALNEKKCVSPLLWCYNIHFFKFVEICYSPLKIYHATEDYFAPEFYNSSETGDLPAKLIHLLRYIDLVVAVSDGVRDSYSVNGHFTRPVLVLTNGCDFRFWQDQCPESDLTAIPKSGPVVIYQGGINFRLDVDLLRLIIEKMPDVEFWFCGKRDPNFSRWSRITEFKNVQDFGLLPPPQLRSRMRQADVAIIPFVQNQLIVERSFPLKAFEYVACGLPVVSIPILALEPFGTIFAIAKSAEEFVQQIRNLIPTRNSPSAIDARLKVAASVDYQDRFQKLIDTIVAFETETTGLETINTLVLYDADSMPVNTVREHLESFRRFSETNVYYAHATNPRRCGYSQAINNLYYTTSTAQIKHDLSLFSAIVVHYCLRLSQPDHIADFWVDALKRFPGLKILFIQDEYDTTETAREWIEVLGFQVVYTCVPAPYVEMVYPKGRFPRVTFISTLTGYVPIFKLSLRKVKPTAKRAVLIGYRGRDLPYWYGRLGQEKALIGKMMKEVCLQKGLSVDIEWTHDQRIYGAEWYEFLSGCKATLGTESGANIFDDYGEIKNTVEQMLKDTPNISFDEVHEKYLSQYEGKVSMNQISPKVFEAILLRTALVLFEGSYSNVLVPYKHFIPLKKDFSNIDNVLDLLRDDAYLQNLADTAYTEIIASGNYSYPKFIEGFDEMLASQVRAPASVKLASTVTMFRQSQSGGWDNVFDKFRRYPTVTSDVLTGCELAAKLPPLVTVYPLSGGAFLYRLLMATWAKLPLRVRHRLKPLANRIARG